LRVTPSRGFKSRHLRQQELTILSLKADVSP
jgi:hypothetical protein